MQQCSVAGGAGREEPSASALHRAQAVHGGARRGSRILGRAVISVLGCSLGGVTELCLGKNELVGLGSGVLCWYL